MTNAEYLADAEARCESAGPVEYYLIQQEMTAIRAAMKAGTPFQHRNPRCVYCQTELVVPGDPCRGCGKPCLDSFVAPEQQRPR